MDAHWEAHGLYHVEQQHCLISPSKILFGYIKLWGYNLVLKIVIIIMTCGYIPGDY